MNFLNSFFFVRLLIQNNQNLLKQLIFLELSNNYYIN